MSVIKELDEVALTVDLPETGLKAGDTGIVVHAFTRGRGFAVEFSTVDGDTIALVNLPENSLRHPRHNEITSLRTLESISPAA